MSQILGSIYQFTKTDKLIFICFLVIFPLLMLKSDEDPVTYFDTVSIIILTINSVILVYIIIFVLFKKYVASGRLKTLAISIFLLLLAITLLDCLIYYIGFRNEPIYEKITLVTYAQLMIFHVILGGLLLGIIMFRKNIKSQILLLKADSVQKSNNLMLLKAQMDPHFLFNNLNTLDALMDIDVKKAKIYVNRLAKLYQYLLVNKDEETVDLKEELNFAKDYSYLIIERFGQNYQFNFAFENDKIKNKLLLPGSIQTLFENIVKHNTATEKKPVVVDIIITEHEIEIKNNIQIKHNSEPSYGIGLENLRARYRLLSDKNIEIKIDDNYTVRLPLLDQLNP